MKLKHISENIKCSAAAPAPKVLANEHFVYLIFYLEDISVQDAANSPFNRVPIDQICSIRFNKYIKYQLNSYKVDYIEDHEYSELGLESSILQEVVNSDWIDDFEECNDIENQKKHIIIPMKDSCFEVVCKDYTLMSNPCQTIREEVLRLADLV